MRCVADEGFTRIEVTKSLPTETMDRRKRTEPELTEADLPWDAKNVDTLTVHACDNYANIGKYREEREREDLRKRGKRKRIRTDRLIHPHIFKYLLFGDRVRWWKCPWYDLISIYICVSLASHHSWFVIWPSICSLLHRIHLPRTRSQKPVNPVRFVRQSSRHANTTSTQVNKLAQEHTHTHAQTHTAHMPAQTGRYSRLHIRIFRDPGKHTNTYRYTRTQVEPHCTAKSAVSRSNARTDASTRAHIEKQ